MEQKRLYDILAWFSNVSTSVIIVFVNKVGDRWQGRAGVLLLPAAVPAKAARDLRAERRRCTAAPFRPNPLRRCTPRPCPHRRSSTPRRAMPSHSVRSRARVPAESARGRTRSPRQQLHGRCMAAAPNMNPPDCCLDLTRCRPALFTATTLSALHFLVSAATIWLGQWLSGASCPKLPWKGARCWCRCGCCCCRCGC